MKHQLYGKTVSIDFNEAKHEYLVTDQVLGTKDQLTDSVTAITGIVDKPFLRFWTVKVMHEYLQTNWQAGVAYDEIAIKTMLDEGKRAHTVRLTQAGDIGTLVHSWCEQYIKNQIAGTKEIPPMPVNEQARNGAQVFLDWATASELQFELSEQKVYSRKHNYVGTLDFTARVGKKGARIMGDIKTSNFFDPQMFWQVSGYQLARQEEYPKEKYAMQVIVRCGKDGTLEVRNSTDFKKDSKAFLACREVHRRLKEINAK